MIHIPKSELVRGIYYKGRCRNATVARWDGERFHHWRTKFGYTFLEEIKCPEDEHHYDVFYAQEVTDVTKEIPIDGDN